MWEFMREMDQLFLNAMRTKGKESTGYSAMYLLSAKLKKNTL